MFKQNDISMCDNVRKNLAQCPLPMDLGGQLIWIGLMECLDYIRCIHKVFGQFTTHGIQGVVKPFPLNEVRES